MNYGWVYNEEKILAATARIESSGFKFNYSADRPQMAGYWKYLQSRGVTHIHAGDFEKKLNGKWRNPNSQSRGTCVGQGSSRAIEDVHNARLVNKVIVGKPTLIAFEPMYGYERRQRWGGTHPWGCNCGNCNDGLCGADAAAFYSTIGVIARGVYQGIDLIDPHEKLAIDWNNSGVPDVLIKAAAFHKIFCHTSSTWSEYADAIAAECFGHVCLPKIFQGGRVDANGYCEPDGDGGHDTECCGVSTAVNHETLFIMQQSWGNAAKYPPIIQTACGPREMRPGSYAVRQSVLEGIRGGVERISCDVPPQSSFR